MSSGAQTRHAPGPAASLAPARPHGAYPAPCLALVASLVGPRGKVERVVTGRGHPNGYCIKTQDCGREKTRIKHKYSKHLKRCA